ncbi:MAG: NAD(P)-dependent oxidoreductase [Chloroflexota bacterium]
MKIAITGGNGRVGPAVIDFALAQGHTVVSIDRIFESTDSSDPRITRIQLDTAQYDPFCAALKGCDALIHLAAIPAPVNHPDHIVHNNNVASSYNALRAAAELGITRVCQASSINAIGGVYSRSPRYDYFPVDEKHPTYAEDPYSLSKWICEIQADAIARRFEAMTIASLRIHAAVDSKEDALSWQGRAGDALIKHLWGYTTKVAIARACLLSLTVNFKGHEVFYIIAPQTMMNIDSLELRNRFYPNVPIRGELSDALGFFDCRKAEHLLGWRHDTD